VIAGDVITTLDDRPADGGATPLLKPVMRAGRPLAPLPSLEEIRACASANLAHLPGHIRALETEPLPPVEKSDALRRLAADVDRQGH
jgi:nicotinate phosphoribosyltransferase